MNRRRVLMVFGAAATALSAGGLGVGRLVRSPQQLRAETAAPPPTVLTATVERRVLRDTVVLRGVVSAQASIEATPGLAVTGRSVVSGVRVKAGQRVAQGAVLVEVSGRPLVALLGRVPSYRDLRPGMKGRDVGQLQAALRALGHNPRDAAGTFGAGTKRAVETLYQQIGYAPATTGEDGLRQLAAAADLVHQRERGLTQARDALDLLQHGSPSATGQQPDRATAITEAQRQVQFAEEDFAASRAALADLERTTGAMLPMSEVVFVPAFPARVEKVGAAVGGEVKAPLITLSSGALVVRGRLNPADRTLMKTGLPVQVNAELLGLTAPGVVASVGDMTKDEDGTHYYPMVVTAIKGVFAEPLNGADVRLSVAAASTAASVLVVPVSAVFADAGGQTSVLRQGPEGQDRIVVDAGPSGDGYVAVAPVQGTLEPGDAVVIGVAAR
jgi:HlyD family secretion protein